MHQYINNGSRTIYLIGPAGERVAMVPGKPETLPEFFEIYVRRHKIARLNQPVQQKQAIQPMSKRRVQPVQPRHIVTVKPNRISANRLVEEAPRQTIVPQDRQNRVRSTIVSRPKPATPVTAVRRPSNRSKRPVVGRTLDVNAIKHLNEILTIDQYPISNGIGVGILSYNRPLALKRLVESIRRFTRLNNTTIFISDDASTNPELLEYLRELKRQSDFVVITNSTRLGIAGNSNRLLQCLQRFDHCLLLNDDVEIKANGWDVWYKDSCIKTGMHHFCYREPGVYGAVSGNSIKMNGLELQVVLDKPHGAVLAFTNYAFKQVGYFDESFGVYGFEHVDWSSRLQASNSIPGFFDVSGSNNFFKIHPEASAVENRHENYAKAKTIWSNKKLSGRYLECPSAPLDSISYVIPYRDIGRVGSIVDVVDNIRAQRFPVIDIVVSEHDITRKCPDVAARHILETRNGHLPFNKSIAFNKGVYSALNSKVVLHDADMLVPVNYTAKVYNLLDSYESCHIGKTVAYLEQESSEFVHKNKLVVHGMSTGRVVGYYEGGSLACTKAAYSKVGGFNESFVGYGVEDCEFYERLSSSTKWHGDRTENLIHLWHPRSAEWNSCHIKNTEIYNGLKKLSLDQRIAALRRSLMDNGFIS